jgi:hypothetical protein
VLTQNGPGVPISKVGTVCVRSASTGLCGGQRVTAVLTATGGCWPKDTPASSRAGSGMNVRSGSKGLSYLHVRIRSACSTEFYAGRERW